MSDCRDNFKNFAWGGLLDLCKDICLIGISLMTHGVKKAIEIRKVLARNIKASVIINSLNSFKGLFPYYDFIGMNPFEIRDDLVSFTQFIKKIPVPFFFSNNLAFYPGTKISERAAKAGIDIRKRDRHTDAKHGYSVLKNENIKHKLFHLILLTMGVKANRIKVGGMLRIIISDGALKLFCFLDKRCGYATDKICSFIQRNYDIY